MKKNQVLKWHFSLTLFKKEPPLYEGIFWVPLLMGCGMKKVTF